jgi:hypothetical protein
MTGRLIRDEIGGEVSRLLFEGGAIHVSRQQPFVLAAGWASPVYVDVRIILGEPELRRAVTDLAAAMSARCCRRMRSRRSPAPRPPAFPLPPSSPTGSM